MGNIKVLTCTTKVEFNLEFEFAMAYVLCGLRCCIVIKNYGYLQLEELCM